MGAFDTPTGVNLALHIYVADKGDYYEIADVLPQYDTHPGILPVPPLTESPMFRNCSRAIWS